MSINYAMLLEQPNEHAWIPDQTNKINQNQISLHSYFFVKPLCILSSHVLPLYHLWPKWQSVVLLSGLPVKLWNKQTKTKLNHIHTFLWNHFVFWDPMLCLGTICDRNGNLWWCLVPLITYIAKHFNFRTLQPIWASQWAWKRKPFMPEAQIKQTRNI
jgi:hypothetical protein